MPYRDPEQRRAVKRESARLRRQGESGPRRRPLPQLAELRFESGKTALLLLQEQIHAVQNLKVEKATEVMSKARTLAYLLSLGMKVLEAAQLESRITILEEEFHEALYRTEGAWQRYHGESEG